MGKSSLPRFSVLRRRGKESAHGHDQPIERQDDRLVQR